MTLQPAGSVRAFSVAVPARGRQGPFCELVLNQPVAPVYSKAVILLRDLLKYFQLSLSAIHLHLPFHDHSDGFPEMTVPCALWGGGGFPSLVCIWPEVTLGPHRPPRALVLWQSSPGR